MKKSLDQILLEYKAKKQAKAQREATRIKNAIAKASKITYQPQSYDPDTYNNKFNAYPTYHKFQLQLVIVERKQQFEKGITQAYQIIIKNTYKIYLPYKVAQHIIRHFQLKINQESETFIHYEPLNCEIAISYKAATNHHILTIIKDTDTQHCPIQSSQAINCLIPAIQNTFNKTYDKIINYF